MGIRWRAVVAAKVLLSQLKVPYSVWRRLGLFRLGRMDSFDYPIKIFDLHVRRAFGSLVLDGKTILEIGPGDSLSSVVIGRTYGATRTILVDASDYATNDMTYYRTLANQLRAAGLDAPSLDKAATREDLLAVCGGQYLTSGIDSFSQIETHSVDFIWSHSVMEHIPKNEVSKLLTEFRRVLKPGALMSHNIDFQDHLERSINSLRFSEKVWESPWMSGAGFYTNRIRGPQMHGLIRNAGFTVLTEDFGRWPSLPVPRIKLDLEYRNLDDDALLIRTSHILARS